MSTSRRVETAAEAISRLTREVADLRSWINVRAPTPAQSHTSLSGVTSDQHHDKSHAHDGADGSGTVDHDDLDNVTAGQHHAWPGAHADLTGLTIDDHHQHLNAICLVSRITTGEVFVSGSWTEIEWNSEVHDPGDWHDNSINPDRLTNGLGHAGAVLLIAKVGFASNTATKLGIRFLVNGNSKGSQMQENPTGAAETLHLPLAWNSSAGDYVTVEGYQDQGSNLNSQTGLPNMMAAVYMIRGEEGADI